MGKKFYCVKQNSQGQTNPIKLLVTFRYKLCFQFSSDLIQIMKMAHNSVIIYSLISSFLPTYIVSVYKHFNMPSYISGLKLRRQHWFFLGCLCVVLIFSLAICVPISTSTSAFDSELMNNPVMQQQAVAQLLQDVPLIDG